MSKALTDRKPAEVTSFSCDGQNLCRAHHWDDQGRYSTKTFLSQTEAQNWLIAKDQTNG